MDIRKNAFAAAVAALALAGAPALAAPPAPAVFDAAHGGMTVEPVSADGYVYLGHGATISAWNRSQPGAPVRAGDTRATPLTGWVTGMVRRGDYLYASYRGYESEVAGVAVYSIADRARPVLLGQYGNYTNAPIRFAMSIALVGDKLLLLDSENGIFTGNLADPTHPVFTQSYQGYGAFHYATVDGTRLIVTGRNFLDGTNLYVFDVSNPAAINVLGDASLDGYSNFRVKVQAPYAIGFGISVAVNDFTDPTNILQRGLLDAPVSYQGLVLGNHAWGVGGFYGVEVFDLANLDAPVHLGTTEIDTFSTLASTTIGNEGWLSTRDDRLIRLDAANPAVPALAGTGLVAGGTAPMDVALKDDTALILGNSFGLQSADAATLAPVGRYVTSITPSLQARAFERLAVDGNRAYLVSWGTGLVVADVTNPRAPVELGKLEYPFASSVDARGNFAYFGTTTNGGIFVVTDVTNPAAPVERGTWPHPSGAGLFDIDVRGDFAYVAAEIYSGVGGGLHILDISNPDAPAEVGHFEGTCGSARDVELDRSGTVAYVACNDATWIVDVSNPMAPVALGSYPGMAYSVALRGDRLYVGFDTGVRELDVSNSAAPTLVDTMPLQDTPRRVRAPADGKVYAITGTAGVFVYKPDRLFADGAETP